MNCRTGLQLSNDTQFDQIKLKFTRLIDLWNSNFDQLLTAFVHFNLNSRPNVSSDLLWLKRWIVEHINIHHHCKFQHHNPIRRRDIEFWKQQLNDLLNLDLPLIESIFIDSATSARHRPLLWRGTLRGGGRSSDAPLTRKWLVMRWPASNEWNSDPADPLDPLNLQLVQLISIQQIVHPKKKNIIEILHVGAYLSWYFDGYLKLSRTLKSAERT